MSDPEWLARIAWETTAPQSLIRESVRGRINKLADALAKCFRPVCRKLLGQIERGQFLHPVRLLEASSLLADDGSLQFVERERPVVEASDVHAHWIKTSLKYLPTWKRAPSRKLSQIMQEVIFPASASSTPPGELLVSLWALIATSTRLSDEALVNGWIRLLQVCHDVVHVRPGSPSDEPVRDLQLDPAQGTQALLDAELLVVTGLVYQHVLGAGQLLTRGLQQADVVLEGCTDSDGSPHACWLPHLSPGVLSALRLVWIEKWWGQDWKLPERFRERLSLLLTRVAALQDTQLVPCVETHPEGLAWGMKVLGIPSKSPAMRSLLRQSISGKQRSDQEEPASQSDWSRLAILRSDWGVTGDVCIVDHSTESTCRLQTRVRGRIFLSGVWDLELRVGGELVTYQEDWLNTCWNSDEDGDYFELGRDGSHGVSLIRQIFLSRTDSFLYLADSVTWQGGPIEYISRLPIVAGWDVLDDGLTREKALVQGQVRVRVVPPGLPQHYADAATGSLETRAGHLVCRSHSDCGGLCFPVLIEWSPARVEASVDWSILSAVEGGRLLSCGEALGTRVRIGHAQWMFYRSLRPGRLPRTVMGHHTPYEAVVARFDAGEFHPLLNVEA